jgi:hypothetical protein
VIMVCMLYSYNADERSTRDLSPRHLEGECPLREDASFAFF